MAPAGPRAIPITALLTEAELADELVRAMAARHLPEKFFYWFPLSVKAWLGLCTEGPYRNYSRSETLVGRSASVLPPLMSAPRLEVISLGAGQGVKDLHVLRALAAAGKTVTYTPLDASLSLLEMAWANAAAEGFQGRAVKADLTNAAHLGKLLGETNGWPRLLLLLGNSLGAFDPLTMLRVLTSFMRNEDRLLVDGELGYDGETRAGYDNPRNRAFAFAPLKSLGLSEQDGTLSFEALPELRPEVHRLGKRFELARDVSLLVAGQTTRLTAGERITMSHSGKYTEKAFLGLLSDAGLTPVRQFTSDDDRLLMVLAKPCTAPRCGDS